MGRLAKTPLKSPRKVAWTEIDDPRKIGRSQRDAQIAFDVILQTPLLPGRQPAGSRGSGRGILAFVQRRAQNVHDANNELPRAWQIGDGDSVRAPKQFDHRVC